MEEFFGIAIICIVAFAIVFFLVRQIFGGSEEENTKLTSSDHTVTPDQVDDPDPFMREIIAQVWNTGKAVSGTRNPDGTTTMKTWNDD